MAQRIWTSEDLKEIGLHTEEEVHRITSAETRQSVDVDARARSYTIRMAIRVICIVTALFCHGWVQFALIIGAAIIPWVAVVAANGANRQPRADFSQYLSEDQVRMLESVKQQASEEHEEAEPAPDIDIIEGEIVEEKDGE